MISREKPPSGSLRRSVKRIPWLDSIRRGKRWSVQVDDQEEGFLSRETREQENRVDVVTAGTRQNIKRLYTSKKRLPLVGGEK
jgi:hypothetical protein